MPIKTHPTHGVLLAFFLLLKPVSPQHATPEQPAPPPPPSYNFSPAMATAVIILIIFFFSVGFISVYIRHLMLCLGVNLGRSEGGGIQGWRRGGLLARGLDPTLVDTFPTFLYSDVKIHRVDKSPLECAICLNEFTDHEILRMLPPCNHVFHPNCVGPWLDAHVTCPVCRENLEFNLRNRSIDCLTQQLEQLSQSSNQDDCEQSSNHHNNDVIVGVGTSHEDIVVITSPVISKSKFKDGPIGELRRSHSTGHSLIDDCERYTLRLPKDVRNKLVNVDLSGLSGVLVSPRAGYRARSVGCTNPDDVKSDHWRFSVSPPFISRAGSAWSPKSDGPVENNNSNSSGIMSGPINLFKSIKSPLNRVTRSDDIGERSTNRLWVNRTAQDIELEAQWSHDQ